MPGFTHLQSAQPVTLGHLHLMAWHEMIRRDASRFADARVRLDQCPLGSAALAGTGFPIDRMHRARGRARLRRANRQFTGQRFVRDFALDYLMAWSVRVAFVTHGGRSCDLGQPAFRICCTPGRLVDRQFDHAAKSATPMRRNWSAAMPDGSSAARRP